MLTTIASIMIIFSFTLNALILAVIIAYRKKIIGFAMCFAADIIDTMDTVNDAIGPKCPGCGAYHEAKFRSKPKITPINFDDLPEEIKEIIKENFPIPEGKSRSLAMEYCQHKDKVSMRKMLNLEGLHILREELIKLDEYELLIDVQAEIDAREKRQ